MSYWNEKFLNKLKSSTPERNLLKLKIFNDLGRLYFFFIKNTEKNKLKCKVLFFLD